MTEHKIRVVCTDKGRHRIRPLATIVVDSEGRVSLDFIPKGGTIERRWSSPERPPVEVNGVWRFPDTDASRAADTAAPVWRFDCPSCWRTPEISAEHWRALWAGYADLGETQVDISRMGI